MATPSASLPEPLGAAPLKIVVTDTGQAWVGQQAVRVPPGTDPRAAAAAVASAQARRQGRDLPAVLVGPGRRERHRMLFTAKGQVLWEPESAGRRRPAADPRQQATLRPRPDPPEDFDPATIPAWPHYYIEITE